MNRVSKSAMIRGVTYVLAATVLWALAFLVPMSLGSFGPVEITLGRYLAYGLVSLAILVFTGHRLRSVLDRRMWLRAVTLAFTGNIGYYFFLVLGLKYAGPAVTTLVVGTLPVTVALYGNWRRREYPFRRLLGPVGLILIGLLAFNVQEIGSVARPGSSSLSGQLVGIGCGVVALVMWTWFGVANAEFLKTHPEISAATWSTLLGVGTLVWALAALPLTAVTGGEAASLASAASSAGAVHTSNGLWPLAVGSVVLGVAVSWGGSVLWNRASALLPVSLAGQLLVFETIFGLAAIYVYVGGLPSPVEILSVFIILGGVLLGIRGTRHVAPGAPIASAPALESCRLCEL
jgi:drug/metabolite transporter (DMT)-like permease